MLIGRQGGDNMTDSIKRNPKWTRDEIILALNVYFKVNIHNLSVHSDSIIELSNLLQKLNAYENGNITATYRNPSGVHMKLMNFYSIESPGKGLQNASKLDRIIYSEFINDKDQLNLIANKIIYAISNGIQTEIAYEDEGFMEGAILEKQHKYKERNVKVVKAKKSKVLKEQGCLQCEVCDFVYKDVYGELGNVYIECHHILPLADIDIEKETKLKDLALVCANCHRMLHKKRPWITVQELKDIISKCAITKKMDDKTK